MRSDDLEKRFGTAVALPQAAQNIEELLEAASKAALTWPRLATMRRALTCLLLRPDSKDVVERLRTHMSNPHSANIRPMVASFLHVFAMQEECRITMVLSLFRPEAPPDDTIRPEFLQTRVEQLEDLFAINPRITWRLIVVYEPHQSLSEERLWVELLHEKYPLYTATKKIGSSTANRGPRTTAQSGA